MDVPNFLDIFQIPVLSEKLIPPHSRSRDFDPHWTESEFYPEYGLACDGHCIPTEAGFRAYIRWLESDYDMDIDMISAYRWAMDKGD